MDVSQLYDLPTSFGSRKRHASNSQSQKGAQQQRLDFESIVDDHFEKKFTFNPQEDDWELKPPDEMFGLIKWKNNRLQALKAELNSVKGQLDDFNLDEWHRHTRMMNKAGEIQFRLRNDFEPEFVTQAWCKFYENVMSFPLIPNSVVDGDEICSIHLCEAPGAFIASLNHYMKTNRPYVKWNWLATTLNPHYEGNPLSTMINDDRFIMRTMDHWSFGQDCTGNLMCLKNMNHLMDKARDQGKVMLVTADGSIDCQGDPGEQEAVVSRLHYCETVTALHLLAQGGSFLLKMFTMFESDTVCLMYLLCCAFKQVTVNKPATSKEGNSEVYVVCLDYRGVDFMQPWLKVLRENFGPNILRNTMFVSVHLPDDFMTQIELCSKKFTDLQIKVIKNNISTFTIKRDDPYALKTLRRLIAKRFLEVYNIQMIAEADEIVGRTILNQMGTPNIESRSSTGSFSDRLKREELPKVMKLSMIEEEMDSLNVQWPFEESIRWLQFPDKRMEATIRSGLPVVTVRSSKFCLGKLLSLRGQVRRLAAADMTFASRSEATITRDGSDKQDERGYLNALKTQFPHAVILDFKTSLWSCLEVANHLAEATAFRDISKAMHGLCRGHYLILVGYPMLTQFNAGLVYALGHMFEQVGFVRPNGLNSAIVFKNFRYWDDQLANFLEKVGRYVNLCESVSTVAVLAIVPIGLLCGMNVVEGDSLLAEEGDSNLCVVSGLKNFYSSVVDVNNMCVMEETALIIASALSAFSDKSNASNT